jgi:hypothetical protein
MIVVGGLMLLDQSFLGGTRGMPSEFSLGFFAWSVRIIFGLSLVLIAVLYSFIPLQPPAPLQ